ncbi:hypothetical protein NL676_002264 [Syzygium grande]|nr:hypothetical protein NL676_002264 [Syzygium grande]
MDRFTFPVVVSDEYHVCCLVRLLDIDSVGNAGSSPRCRQGLKIRRVDEIQLGAKGSLRASAIEGPKNWIWWRISSAVLLRLQGETVTQMETKERGREDRNVKRTRGDD